MHFSTYYKMITGFPYIFVWTSILCIQERWFILLYIHLDWKSLEIIDVWNSRPDFAELQNHIRTNKWQELGIQLGVEKNKLEAIRQQYRDYINDCRREMLTVWLDTTTKASRQQLINSLRTSAVAENHMAEQYKTYIHNTYGAPG